MRIFRTSLEQTHTIAFQLEQLSEAVIKPVIRRKLRASLDPADTSARNLDALELVSAVQISLLAEAERFPDSYATILDLEGFAARVTANVCYQYFRSKFPVRTQVENKIRYLIKHEPRFALWKGRDGRWLAGLSEFAAREVASPLELDDDLPIVATSHGEREHCIAILDSAFRRAKGPVRFATLIEFVMRVRNIHESSAVLITDPDLDPLDLIADRAVRADRTVEIRSRLRHLWHAILKLSVSDRLVLLLNLKDDAGDSLVPIFVFTGVARVDDIADALEQTPEQLAAIWNSLPWDDNTIARHTQQTRQQVINRRYAARRRLAALINEK